MPRMRPVSWSWSTTSGSWEPQITHSVVVAFSSIRASSEMTARNFPRLFAFLYSERQERHQLSSPFRFRLCGGKNSAVAGLSARQRVQVSSSMLSTTTLYALVALFRLSSAPACQTSLRKKSRGGRRLFWFSGEGLGALTRACPGWPCCKTRGLWRLGHPLGPYPLSESKRPT